MSALPLIMTESGPVPTPPASIQQQLLLAVESTSPGYTARLPGLLIEDISSTDVAAIVQCDSARVELINSITPYGANAFLLNQMGQITGISQAPETNTTVQVVFTGTPNFVIAPGFTVSDGAYQYYAVDGGIISAAPTGSSVGVSPPLTFVATITGSWAVPQNTVTTIETSVSSTITLSCNNPYAGTPGNAAQTESDYRGQVLQAWSAPCQGAPGYAKTLIGAVPGVQTRLVSIQQQSNGWKVLVGGEYDANQVALAIYNSMTDISRLVSSSLTVVGITNTVNAIVTTSLNHGFSNGQIVYLANVQGMTTINGMPLTVTVINQTSFYTGVNTLGMGGYVTGGTLTPNFRNNLVPVIDYPDVYNVPFISPPQQVVTGSVTWNTSATNFINVAAISQLTAPALAAYVNAINVAQPMNLFDLQDAFRNSVASILSPALLTRLVFAISINGVAVSPSTGTGLIAGDSESYFWSDPSGSGFTVTQG